MFRQGLSRRFGRGFQGSRVHLVRLNSPPMAGRSTGGRDPNHSDKCDLIVDEFRDRPARANFPLFIVDKVWVWCIRSHGWDVSLIMDSGFSWCSRYIGVVIDFYYFSGGFFSL